MDPIASGIELESQRERLCLQETTTDNQFLDSASGISVFLEEKVSKCCAASVPLSHTLMQQSRPVVPVNRRHLMQVASCKCRSPRPPIKLVRCTEHCTNSSEVVIPADACPCSHAALTGMQSAASIGRTVATSLHVTPALRDATAMVASVRQTLMRTATQADGIPRTYICCTSFHH